MSLELITQHSKKPPKRIVHPTVTLFAVVTKKDLIVSTIQHAIEESSKDKIISAFFCIATPTLVTKFFYAKGQE